MLDVDALPDDYFDPHDQSLHPFYLRPSNRYPTTHGHYFNTLLRWTDSYLTLDAHYDYPDAWLLPRILAQAFMCRVSNHPMTRSTLLPEARRDPELFGIVYTLSMLQFFSITASAQDPHWMRAVIHLAAMHKEDLPALTGQLMERYTNDQLQDLIELLQADNPNRAFLALPVPHSDEDDILVVDLDDLEPINPAAPQFAAEENDTIMYDGTGPTYIPVPLPNIPAVRITPTSMEFGRNVAVSMPGISIWSYDTPPPVAPQHNPQLHNLEQQMLLMQQTLLQLLPAPQRLTTPADWPTSARARTPSLREVDMDDAPPSPRYTTKGALPRIVFSPPPRTSTSPSSQATLHRRLENLSINTTTPKPQQIDKTSLKPPSVVTMPASEPKRALSPTKTPTNLPRPAGSPDRAKSPPIKPETDKPHSSKDQNPLGGSADTSSADGNKPATLAPQSSGSQHSEDQDVEADAAKTAAEADAIRAKQAEEFQVAYAQRLTEENADLEAKVLAMESKAQQARLQIQIKEMQEQRAALQARMIAAEKGHLEAHSANQTQKTRIFSRYRTPDFPGAFGAEDSPSVSEYKPDAHPAPPPAPPQPSTAAHIDATLEMLAQQAPEALEELKKRIRADLTPSHVDMSAARFAQSTPYSSTPAPRGGMSGKKGFTEIPALAPQGGTIRSNVYGSAPHGGMNHGSQQQGTPQEQHPEQQRGRSQSKQHPNRESNPNNDPDDDSSSSSDSGSRREDSKSDSRSRRRRRRARRRRRRELEGKPIRNPAQQPSTTNRRLGTPAYLGRLHAASLEPELFEDEATCRAPPDFLDLYPYDPELLRCGNKKFNDRYDSRRIPIFHEATMPVDNWMTKLHVEVTINGQEAVCPLIGAKAFPEGTFLHRWFNNLSHCDLMLLTIGPHPWRNWQFAVYNLREHLNPLIRHQAESRVKKPEESYHAYITSRYTLLKAAFPYEPEIEIIRRLKAGFQDRSAFTIMRETMDIRKLEREALEYEEMQTTMNKNRPVVATPGHSSYLKLSGTYLPESDEDQSAHTFAVDTRPQKPRYQQKPASQHNVYPLPADVARDADLHPDVKKGRKKLPADQMTPVP
ncbi:hypothetical protein BJ508DRAFT_315346 [Ascobolus immersus RN42]|uniref:Uncharacterized protein n=1 Tax=Ascobolus immersus RN42 TaxID=1160509 RepID=A0A3N4HEY6_ASCIM|nr:hypothetical protein BJ508DRAFT_315346 [Ascobolus immersus RN42]